MTSPKRSKQSYPFDAYLEVPREICGPQCFVHTLCRDSSPALQTYMGQDNLSYHVQGNLLKSQDPHEPLNFRRAVLQGVGFSILSY